MILLGWEVERDYSIISFVALTVDQKRCDYEYEEKSLVATSGFHPREEKMENLREQHRRRRNDPKKLRKKEDVWPKEIFVRFFWECCDQKNTVFLSFCD